MGLFGVLLVASTRAEVALAAIECVQAQEDPLVTHEDALLELQECERQARHTGTGLGYVGVIFALAGVVAAVLGSCGRQAGGSESEAAMDHCLGHPRAARRE